MDEEFEEAARLKKAIIQLKEKTITAEKLRSEYLDKKPIISCKTMLEKMNKIDPVVTLGLTKPAPKMNIMSILLLLQNITSAEKGLV